MRLVSPVSDIVVLSCLAQWLQQQIIISSKPYYYFMHAAANGIINSTSVTVFRLFVSFFFFFFFLTWQHNSICSQRKTIVLRGWQRGLARRGLLGEGFLCLWEERRGDGKWFGVFLRSEGIFSSLSIWLWDLFVWEAQNNEFIMRARLWTFCSATLVPQGRKRLGFSLPDYTATYSGIIKKKR